jgi:molybdopterin/thiamine biosynthesis adenylyltransferase
MAENLKEAIDKEAENGLLSLERESTLASQHKLTLYELETILLQEGIFPARFARNRHTFTAEDQLHLHRSHCLVIGCGGIGGHIAELLVRSGVGRLTLFDPDSFDESNLNRQNFSDTAHLHKPKVEVCTKALQVISPVAKIESHTTPFPYAIPDRFQDCSLLIEASDSPQLKRCLSLEAKRKKIPFLHAAIAGKNALLSLDTPLDTLYENDALGSESWSGTLAATAAFAASVAASQAIDLLLGKGCRLEREMLFVDLERLECEWIAKP